ncbi:hypothetical protein A0J61_11129 [Choanephora cucurbitarum]|uniref:Uncharacterized protein n=1 Tax=Choanephora cucurbitarum TaxID=101091 RepID=A0A1C7MVC6_9FUNG|nr:hypothetical protein A0J61_11129 [Choanephora cucurbitarum]
MNIHPKYSYSVRYNGNAAFLGFTGDNPGIAQLINFVRHTGTYGCRICLVVADVHNEHDHGMRGIPQLIGSLETFLDVYSFFGDELHMLGHDIGHLISDLLDPNPRNKFKVANSGEYTIDVQKGWALRSFMEDINCWIDYSKPTTPTIFNFSLDHKKQFFRAVDWQHVLLHVALTIIAPYLKSSTATDALMDLVNTCSIRLQRSISPSELTYMER